MMPVVSDGFDVGTEVWTCARGHPVCGQCICIDVASIVGTDTDATVTIIDGDQDIRSSSSSGNTIQNSFSHLEVSSYVR